jgi:ABC-type Fe3+-hydroxamate transport system substrate-binding protein
MKTAFSFVIAAGALSALGLITSCQSTAVAPSAASQKETLLVRAGFKPKTVTTPKQQQRVAALPPGKVSLVSYKGHLYYVYPTATKDRILVGNKDQYNTYKQMVVANGLTTSPDFVEITHGPHRVLIEEFDGFGPLGD